MITDYQDGRREQLLIPNDVEAAAAFRAKAEEVESIDRLLFFRLSEEQEAIRQAIAEQAKQQEPCFAADKPHGPEMAEASNRHERRRAAKLERSKK